jgi:60 kDa SS-A/Ro ribonucleoprotein
MHGGGESGITRVNLSPRMRLADVVKRISSIPMGGTDCALPMLWAARNKLNVSGFITYTEILEFLESKRRLISLREKPMNFKVTIC